MCFILTKLYCGYRQLYVILHVLMRSSIGTEVLIRFLHFNRHT